MSHILATVLVHNEHEHKRKHKHEHEWKRPNRIRSVMWMDSWTCGIDTHPSEACCSSGEVNTERHDLASPRPVMSMLLRLIPTIRSMVNACGATESKISRRRHPHPGTWSDR